MAKKKITVTAEHIKEGTLNSCTTCPIALALQARGFDAWFELNRPDPAIGGNTHAK